MKNKRFHECKTPGYYTYTTTKCEDGIVLFINQVKQRRKLAECCDLFHPSDPN